MALELLLATIVLVGLTSALRRPAPLRRHAVARLRDRRAPSRSGPGA